MARGWEWLDENNVTEAQMEERRPLLDMLAARWSELHDAEERRGFCLDEDDDRDLEPVELAEYMARERLRVREHAAQMDVVEAELHRLGARMMRTYEHWNEDEAYMQYMEEGRFSSAEGY